MLIAIRLDAGKDADTMGRERRLTLYMSPDGALCDVQAGWPAVNAAVALGPILRITPEEYIFQLQIATGTGL